MALSVGTRLGPYEIAAAIGAGGMGEVYRATDTRLGRDVAIKVLPGHWMDSPDMQTRFRREAQTIASLNHPHICALHDIGHEQPTAGAEPVTFLVMEYLEGETLEARLERGALGLNEALDIAIPIVDALDQAHRRGVVHRDLKPANVMLTPTGPKLLDFGIAKTAAAAPSEPGPQGGAPQTAGPSRFPTTPLTTPGLVIGTLQYMAPEQIEGLEADARTDIFAFGAMLHEMVTGRKAFEAKTQVLLISAIATTDPPALSSVEPRTPPALDHVVKACLAKDPDERWQTARDLLAALRWIAEGGEAATAVVAVAAVTPRSSRPVRVLGATAAALAVVMAIPSAQYLIGGDAPTEVRYRIGTSVQQTNVTRTTGTSHIAISPDGSRVVFQGTPSPWPLTVNQVGTLAFQPLPGTEEANERPFWSPDGQSIAFFTGGVISKVDTSGGLPKEVAKTTDFFGGAWNDEGTIVFGSATGIQRVSAEGGTPEPVTTLADAETGHYWPKFLPDERRFLYLAWSSDASARAIFVGSLDGAAPVRVMAAESNAIFTRPTAAGQGYLLFHRDAALFAQPFDERGGTLRGEPERIADDVVVESANGWGDFDVSTTGVLICWVIPSQSGNTGNESWPWVPVWADPTTGQVIAPAGPEGTYRGVEVSPDGARVAMHRHDGEGGDVWVIEPQGTRTRITFDPAADNSMPVWSPDGADLVFSARRDGKWGLYRTRSDGSTDATLLYESELPKVPTSWSNDGSIVFWQQDPKTKGDLWRLPPQGGSPGTTGNAAVEPEPLLTSPADERHGQVSPDGRWLAYTSDATEPDVQVYVRPFPTGSGRWQMSIDAADFPRWSRDGKTLFFKAANPAGAATASVQLFGVDVSVRDATLLHDPPREVVYFPSVNVAHAGGPYSTYDVSPDPKRLLVFQRNIAQSTAGQNPAATDGADNPVGLIVARHWETNLTQR